MSTSALVDFFERSFQGDCFPCTRYTPSNTSLCQFGAIDGSGMIRWRPVKRALVIQGDVFDELVETEQREFEFIDQARQFTSGFWCSTIDCWHAYEMLVLDCGSWNEREYHVKQVHLRSHFAQQRREDFPRSLPLGFSPSGSGCTYSMRLEDGEVWVEELEGRPTKKAADSLNDFLSGLRHDQVSEEMLDRVFE